MSTTAPTSRIWESPSEPPPHSARPAQLPPISNLTGVLPPGANGASSSPTYPLGNRDRDSDHWPSQPQSTRKFMISHVALKMSFIASNIFQERKRKRRKKLTYTLGSSAYSSGPNGYYYSSSLNSPHRASNSSQQLGSATSHPADYSHPSGSSGAQLSPGFSSPHQSLGLPALNQYNEGSQFRSSHEFPPQESRRSSLGSSVNTGFNNLHINGTTVSPYNSTNASQSSIAISLQRERGIGPTANGVRGSRTSGTMQQTSPLSRFPGESRQAYSSRTAPIISANPKKEVYSAEKPTAGQPYAFPDPEMSQRSSGSNDDPRSTSTMLSRRNSDHTSITSSIFTSDSRLPPGQHRLDDGKPVPVLDSANYRRLMQPFFFLEVSGTHHHSLQHKQVGGLAGESDSPDATSPYSRTPALRASHKMAERKRRTEMKYLFDALRSQIPASHGSKSSKWEILSKGRFSSRPLSSSSRRSKHILCMANQGVWDNEKLRNISKVSKRRSR